MTTEALQFRVWWIPQVPMQAFFHPVASYEEGAMLVDALGRYDLFQYENNVKPDYCNAGGVAVYHPVITEGQWWDLEDEDDAAQYVADWYRMVAASVTSPD